MCPNPGKKSEKVFSLKTAFSAALIFSFNEIHSRDPIIEAFPAC